MADEGKNTGATLGKAYVQIVPSAQGLKASLARVLGSEMPSGSSAGRSLGASLVSGFSDVVKKGTAAVTKAAAASIGAASAGIGVVVKKSLDAYGDYEQLVGGVDTLFGDSSAKVQEYAANAYKNVQLSANEYMETVTGFSASLLQSLDQDTEKAADKADLAITDMADNANKMGTAMADIQHAYQGFAKQNYTMLDNLKLGYGGTQSEMQRLLDDANEINAKQGIYTEYQLGNLADMVDAIHVVQTEMGITGTSAEEAATTVQGSFNMVRSAWENLLTAFGDKNADLDKQMQQLSDSVTAFGKRSLPVVQTAMRSIARAMQELMPKIAKQLPKLINDMLPDMAQAGADMLNALIDGIDSNAHGISDTIVKTIGIIYAAVVENLPKIAKLGGTLAKDIGSELITELPAVINSITTSAIKLAQNTDFGELGQSIANTINELLTTISFKDMGEAVTSLATGLLTLVSEIISTLDWGQVGNDIGNFLCSVDWSGIVSSIFGIIGDILSNTPDLLGGLINSIDFDTAASLVGLAFAPKMVSMIFDTLKNSEAVSGTFAKIRSALKTNITSGAGGAGVSFGTAFTAGLSAFLLGWTIGSEIYKHFHKEIDSVLHPVFDWIVKESENTCDNVKMFWESVKETLGDWGEFFSGLGDDFTENIVKPLKDSAAKAWEWGSDLIDGFIGGIKDKFWELEGALEDFGGMIYDYIHFSEPDKGPLSNFHTFAPDMMDLFAQGIRDNEDVISMQFDKSLQPLMEADISPADITSTSYQQYDISGQGALAQIMALLEEFFPQFIDKDKDIYIDGERLTAKIDSRLGERAADGERGLADVR